MRIRSSSLRQLLRCTDRPFVMQSLAFLLYVCCFLTGVSCSVAAGPYQSVYVWYAYRMDVSAHGVGATNGIAKACRGSNPDGSCKFDELMKDLGKSDWSGSTDIGGDLFPDPVHASEQLQNSGFKNNWDFKKLFPNIDTDGKQPSLSTVFAAVTDRIQAARQALGDDHFVRELQSVKLMITCATEARLFDQANARIAEINKQLKARGITWEVDTMERFGQQRTWTDIDIAQTLANHPNDRQKTIDFITNFEATWFKEKRSGAASHDSAIKACQAAANRLFGSCNM